MKTGVMVQDVPQVAYTPVPRLWPGETVVCLGGGPSLTQSDVDACRGKARVIAIKEAYLLAPWADVLYSCDFKWWYGEKGAPTFAGMKYGLEAGSAKWGVNILRNTGQEGVETDPTGLRTGQNSGYQAVNLAVHFGASRIVLLGFDMWRSPEGKSNWFEGQGIAKSYHVASPYPMFISFFATMVEPLKALGVEVVNCSRSTMLRSFPQMTLEDALL